MTSGTSSKPNMLAPEALAIVRATAPAIMSGRAALRFRMWHHLKDERARRSLFEEFVIGDERVGLIEALVKCGEPRAPHASPRLARQLPPAELARLIDSLKPALRTALRDILGATATDTVLNAWSDTFSHLLTAND